MQPEGRDATTAGEDGGGHRLQEAQPADDAVTAAPATGAAAAPADAELLHPHREAPLQDLRIGESGVGHVGVYRGGPVETRTRPGAAADGLVILMALVAEGQVVHGALGGGQQAEGTVEGIDQALGGLDVAGNHRRRGVRVE